MNILFGTDGSSYALAAARFLSLHLAGGGHQLHLLHVIPEHDGVTTETEQWSQDVLTRTAGPLEEAGVAVRKLVQQGSPTEVLSRLAGEQEFDLVVVGAKGETDAPFFDIGTVAFAVADHAPTNVLVVRGRNSSRTPVATRLDPFRVLFPTDGTMKSATALEAFLDVFDFEHLVGDVVSVVDEAELRPLRRLPRAQREEIHRKLHQEADAHIAEGAARLEDLPVQPERHRLEGKPAECIVDMARKDRADLIVMGSRPLREVGERPLGRVAIEVVRTSPCSVFIVRQP